MPTNEKDNRYVNRVDDASFHQAKKFVDRRTEEFCPAMLREKLLDTDEGKIINESVKVNVAFGQLLRKLRRENDLTQRELSKRSGVSRATITAIEGALIADGPRLATLTKLFVALGTTIKPTIENLHEGFNRLSEANSKESRDASEPREPAGTACNVIFYTNLSRS